jgi:hypothetical protein
MSADDENRFRPKPGRIRSDAPKARQGQELSHAGEEDRAPAQQQPVADRRRAQARPRPPRAARRRARLEGRASNGADAARPSCAPAPCRAAGVTARPECAASSSKPATSRARARTGRAAAHLRYIQRDGTSRDGERGQLYSATEDRADGAAFLERGQDDRHQFRFIVSPEDGADLSDLTAYTRDLMRQVEADLGTKLDWVAVNHHNTGHPHVHVIVRGKDDLGENLVINGDYLANGIRERASD